MWPFYAREKRANRPVAAAFDGRDQREIDYGLATPIALADEYILNTGTAEEALAAFGGIVDRHTVA